MNILSLFDGISCGQIALNRAKVKYDKYFASEIDKFAIKVTQHNYPNTIQLGDVTQIKSENLPKVDLMMGGSPCQGFSFAGKVLNFEDPRSRLFFDFVRLLKECEPTYFLLENVRMRQEYQNIISNFLGVNPLQIDSARVSAQSRVRLYWCNFPINTPEDKGVSLSEIIGSNVKGCARRARYVEDIYGGTFQRLEIRRDNKANCMTTVDKNCKILQDGQDRYLTIAEAEKLQTVPIKYTEQVPIYIAKKLLGNCWTVDVITHIFKGLANDIKQKLCFKSIN